MLTPLKKNNRYMVGLDSLRGLAILGVVLYHVNYKWIPGGFLGVTVFFVLSGYLITDLLATEWEKYKRIDLKNFWIRRARRLLPGMFVMFIIVFAWVTLFHNSLLGKMRGDSLAAVLYISNWWYIYHKLSYFDNFGQSTPLNHFWSLAVEEQFYVVWPFILSLGFYYIKKRSRMPLFIFLGAIASAIAMAVLYEPGSDPSRVYYGTDTRAFSLLIGAVLALLWPSNRLSNKIIPSARLVLDIVGGIALIIILIMFWETNQYDSFLYCGGMLFLSVVTALLVANLAHPTSRISVLLRFKPLRWIGIRSYGIYLWHYPIITLTSSQASTEEPHLTKAIFQVFLILLMAHLSWKFIENPIRQGALKNLRLKDLKIRDLSFVNRVALACTIFLSITVIFGFSTAGKVKDNSKQVRTEAVQVKKNEEPAHPVTKEEKPVDKTLEDENKDSSKQIKQPKTVTAIGDSIMIDVSPYLKDAFPNITIDAKIGRQMSQALEIVEGMKKEGTLGSHVIIGLGTNGAFTTQQLESLIQLIGDECEIVLVNTRIPRPWEAVVNEKLKEVSSKFPNTVLVDWYAASAGNQSYFEPDGIHLNPTGAKEYASLVVQHIDK
ncbi:MULTISPECIES: acyltransferase family protein [Bacillus]|uniref:Acetyltransferase n=1 Tax=Bacillus anthracis TaxID=1392 RepID=A0A2A7D2I8_BACAN|nr:MULTISPECIES: acyltransferase family protein [Bacillus]MCP1166658.1 acetyltransferase [Bacillus sp. 1813sda1]PDZ14149.1 acetyltransferase [Bacillus anthracis]